MSDIPKWALFRGRRCRVLYYVSEGRFRLLDRESQRTVHRDFLTFL